MTSLVVAFDTETALIRPGLHAPPLACVTWQRPGQEARICHWSDALPTVKAWLTDISTLFVGHNVAYDMGVMGAQFPELVPLIFRAYEEDRVTDTMIRQQLIDIASGIYRGRSIDDGRWIVHNYDLQSVAKRLTGRHLDKDEWRLKYGTLRDVPLAEWPDGARVYPLEDARATLDCYLAQEEHAKWIPSQFHEARAAWAQHLQSCWGLRTSAAGVTQLKEATLAELDQVKGRLVEEGLVRPDGTRDTKAACARMEEVTQGECTRTPTGQPKLDHYSCEDSEDPVLIDYGHYTTLNKVLSTDVKMLEQGLRLPIHTRYGLAESGRATSSGPNIQNLRRMPGVREAFVPRPGYVYVDADYNALELWSLAQVQLFLFGHSKLADVLNSGRDPHTALAADMLGITYEEGARRKKDPQDHEFAAARSSQGAKGANFGYPGGLGCEKFVKFSRGSGVTITLERAQQLREAWFKMWPEMTEYFAHINTLCNNPDQLATVVLPSTGMVRSGARFCAAANTYFQGLGAAVTKHAAWLLAKACYVDRDSVLFGSRPVAVIHDQFLVETPEGPCMHEAAMEVAKLMQDAGRKMQPDCVPGVEPVLCRFWSKESVQVFVDGRLVPWPTKTQ